MVSGYTDIVPSDRDIHPPREAAAEGCDYGFSRTGWFEMLVRHCFAGQTILMPEAHIGSASAVLPLVQQKDRISGLANYYSFSYAPMFEGANNLDDRAKLLTIIASELRNSHGRVTLYPLIDDDDDMPALLRRAFAEAGWVVILTEEGTNYTTSLNGRNFAAYWKARPGALRSSVRRKSARYQFELYETLNQTLWDEYLAIYAASWKAAEPYPDMVHAIAEEAARRGALRLGILRDGDRAVAAQLWTIEGDTACIHKIAHDTDEDTHSPGTLLSHHMFEHMIDREKVARIDYGTGDNAYKRDWMEHSRPMLRLECFNPTHPRQWLPALKTRISELVRRAG